MTVSGDKIMFSDWLLAQEAAMGVLFGIDQVGSTPLAESLHFGSP